MNAHKLTNIDGNPLTERHDQPFCFAHLSDPHLSTLDGVRWKQLANKRILGYLSWRRRRRAEHRTEVLEALQRDLRHAHPAHILVTGDLTHIGLPAEFLQARRWLESLGQPQDVTVIPGNHDAYVHSPWEHSFAHWLPYMQSDDSPEGFRHMHADRLFPGLRVRQSVAFISLSTATPSAPFLATGSLGVRQLEKLALLLEKTGQRGLCRVVLIHHPPVPGTEKWRKRLTDARQFCDVIARHGAELVLHGHGHRIQDNWIQAGAIRVPVSGIPSASAIGRKPGRRAQYSLYRIRRHKPGWLIDVSVRAYHVDRDAFFLEQEKRLDLLPQTG